MKSTLVILLLFIKLNLALGQTFDQPVDQVVDTSVVNLADPIKKIETDSIAFIQSTESCEEVVNHHMAIVEQSEKFIFSLVQKSISSLTAYDITMLQKILTARFLHLKKAVDMYRDADGTPTCSPRTYGSAIAVYDFTQLGQQALKDNKLRRIILDFTNFPPYQLTRLKELYDHYTSAPVIQDLLEQINDEKLVLPENLVIDSNRNNGSFVALSDVAINGTTGIVSGAARLWGFISDHLKWRNGHLNKNQEVLELMEQNLKPLDLIYEKRTYVLSNYTIPGHWGHVAVYLGTKEQVQALGLWDKDYFAPFRKAIESGKTIIEVRKKGVNYVSLEDFLNLDEIAITRLNNIKNASDIYEELSEQVDKQYDFAFDAQSSDKITCAELVAFSFGDIHWPETQTLFQMSLKPDDLAVLTLFKNSPMDFVLALKGGRHNTFSVRTLDEWKKMFKVKNPDELVYE